MKIVHFLALISMFCLSGCLEEDENAFLKEEFQYLEEEKLVLKQDLEKAYLELDDYDLKFETFEEVEAKARSADEKDVQLEELRKTQEETEEKMRELRKEFDAYQKKYEAKVRKEGYGEKFEVIEAAGLTLEEVEISKVTETEVKVRHASGFATLNSVTAPKEWKNRFFLRSKEEIAERERELALLLSPPVKEELEIEPERKLSSYQQRALDKKKEQEAMDSLESRAMSAVVIINGDGGDGTGFFAQDGITTYLYTAAHVLDGNDKLKIVDSEGREWKSFGELEVAEGLDLVRLAVTVPVENVLRLRSGGKAAEVGTAVAAMGNADGGGVITKAAGKIKGVGPDSYEISSSILQGNSGGPVMSSDGEVLAVVTHLLQARDDAWARGTASSRVRRFACRIDTKLTWKRTSLSRFIATRKLIDNYDRRSRLIFGLAVLTPTTTGLRLNTRTEGGQTVLEILQENRNLNVVKQLFEINNDLAAKKIRVSERDLRKKFRSFYSSIYQSSASDSLSSSSFSSYFWQEVEASIKYRARANKAMESAIRSLSE